MADFCHSFYISLYKHKFKGQGAIAPVHAMKANRGVYVGTAWELSFALGQCERKAAPMLHSTPHYELVRGSSSSSSRVYVILTSALDDVTWPASHPGRFTAENECSRYSWNEGLMGRASVWRQWRKEKSLIPQDKERKLLLQYSSLVKITL
jgi:hypothetical protein